MSLKDGLILEFLAENNLELAPKPLYRNLNRQGHEIGYSTVRNRVRELAEHGYLDRLDDGYYQVSEKGQAWLHDDLDEFQ